MRRLIVAILSTAFSLAATTYLIHGFSVTPGLKSYLTASIILLLLNTLLLPLIKLLLLPVNLLTLGLFRWIANVIVLYFFDLVSSSVSISAYQFTGFNSSFLALPPVELSFFWTLVLSSFSLSVCYSFISGLLKAEE